MKRLYSVGIKLFFLTALLITANGAVAQSCDEDNEAPVFNIDSGSLDITVYVNPFVPQIDENGCSIAVLPDSFIVTLDYAGQDVPFPDPGIVLKWPMDTFQWTDNGVPMDTTYGGIIETFNCDFNQSCSPVNQFGFSITDSCGNRSEEFLITVTVQDTTPPTPAVDSGALDFCVYVDPATWQIRENGCSMSVRDTALIVTIGYDTGLPDDTLPENELRFVLPMDTFWLAGDSAMSEVRQGQITKFNCDFARGCSPQNQFGFSVTDGCGNRSEHFVLTITLKDTTPPVFMLDSGALDITVAVTEEDTDSSYLDLSGCSLSVGYKLDSFFRSGVDLTGGDTTFNDIYLVWPYDTFMVYSGGLPYDSFSNANIGSFICDFAQGCEPQTMHGVRMYDGCGNLSKVYLITTTFEDRLPPIAQCQDVSVNLEDCGYVMDSLELDGGSYSNCNTIVDFSQDKELFQCSDIGENNVTLTVTDNNGNTDQCQANVTVLSPYCPASGFNPYGWISHVISLNGGMSNTTGPEPGGHGMYYGMTVCDPGTDRYHFWFAKGGPYANSPAYWRVWIDWDHSDTFDPWEVVVEKYTNQGFYHTLFLPSYIPDGQHVMRVGMNMWTGYPAACGFASYGEFEDYTICKESSPLPIQTPDLSIFDKEVEPSFKLYPNPVSEELSVEIDLPETAMATIQVTDPVGKSIYADQIPAAHSPNHIRIDVQEWPAGIYYLKVSGDGWHDVQQFIKTR